LKACYNNLAYNIPKCENGKLYPDNTKIKYCYYCGFRLDSVKKIIESAKRIRQDVEELLKI